MLTVVPAIAIGIDKTCAVDLVGRDRLLFSRVEIGVTKTRINYPTKN